MPFPAQNAVHVFEEAKTDTLKVPPNNINLRLLSKSSKDIVDNNLLYDYKEIYRKMQTSFSKNWYNLQKVGIKCIFCQKKWNLFRPELFMS